MSTEEHRLTERNQPCPAPHPQRPDLACVHPDGHVVHFDGERELWLAPTVADDIALAAAEARGWLRAVAALRDETRWLAFISNPNHDQQLYGEDNHLAAAYLETIISDAQAPGDQT